MRSSDSERRFEWLHTFALRHGGCFTRAHAYDHGLTRHAFYVAVRNRHFIKYRGVYALAARTIKFTRGVGRRYSDRVAALTSRDTPRLRYTASMGWSCYTGRCSSAG